ncbi:hypothetical protein L9F63_020798, partial [Diploptera punctata]
DFNLSCSCKVPPQQLSAFSASPLQKVEDGAFSTLPTSLSRVETLVNNRHLREAKHVTAEVNDEIVETTSVTRDQIHIAAGKFEDVKTFLEFVDEGSFPHTY